MTIESHHRENCKSFLNIAKFWIGQHDFEKAIDALKAAIRNANRARMLRTAGQALVALRRCQDAARYYAAMAPAQQVV